MHHSVAILLEQHIAINNFSFGSNSQGTIGSLDYTNEERIELAKKSLDWTCNVCGKVRDLVKDREADGEANAQKDDQKLTEQEKNDKEMLKMINFKVTACDRLAKLFTAFRIYSNLTPYLLSFCQTGRQ